MPTLRGAFDDVPLSKLIGYGALGVGGAALENQYIGQNVPPELKKVNLSIGGSTGLMLASKSPAMQVAALSAIPLKQMALFGIGGMDRFRRQQQSLVDTNLQTARLNQSAARVNANSAGGAKALGASFLIPALLGGGGAAALAYMAWKKQQKANRRYQTVGEEGTKKPSQKIRIDIPQSALPHDFYDTLRGIDHNPRAHARLQKLRARRDPDNIEDMDQMVRQAKVAYQVDKPEELRAFYKRADQQSNHPTLKLIRDMAWQSTGIPNIMAAGRDLGNTATSAIAGNYDDTKRYSGAAIANGALGLLSARFMAPLALKAIGRGRVTGVIRNSLNGTSRQWSEMPTFAKYVNKWGGGHELGPASFSQAAPMQGLSSGVTDNASRIYRTGAERMGARRAMGLSTASPINRALHIKGRYDPQRYSWTNPTAGGPIFRALATDAGPKSLPGHLINAARYGVNRGVNAAYGTKQFIKRWPNASGFVALPALGGIGVMRDDQQRQEDAMQPHPWFAKYPSDPNAGQYMPASSMATNLLSVFGGGDPNANLRNQVRRG
jgi:hypothetical protein